MEWTNVSIRDEERNFSQITIMSELDGGLDTDAPSSHQRFVSSINHMTEVITNHEISTKRELVPRMESLGGYDSIRSFQEGFSDTGVEFLGNGLEIPLSKSVRDEVALQKRMLESGQAIRLIAPEKFGGKIESFILPIGATLNEAFWDDDRLKITFNY